MNKHLAKAEKPYEVTLLGRRRSSAAEALQEGGRPGQGVLGVPCRHAKFRLCGSEEIVARTRPKVQLSVLYGVTLPQPLKERLLLFFAQNTAVCLCCTAKPLSDIF